MYRFRPFDGVIGKEEGNSKGMTKTCGIPSRGDTAEIHPVARTALQNDRNLLLRISRTVGYGNQHQCWNAAATLASHWNRSLWVPQKAAFAAHGSSDLVSTEVYDWSNLPMTVGLFLPDQSYPKTCFNEQAPVVKLDPVRQITTGDVFASKLGPFHEHRCVVLECVYSEITVFNSDIFPQRWINWWPFHPYFEENSNEIASHMKKQTNKSILGLQIRRGDHVKYSAPLINCEAFSATLQQGQRTACRKGNVTWTWEYVLTHLNEFHNMSTIGAIFCATDDPTWVRNQWKKQLIPYKLYTLSDFQPVALENNSKLSTQVRNLISEMLVLVKVDKVILNAPSSIATNVVRLRLLRRGFAEDDWEHFHTMVQFCLLFYSFRPKTKTTMKFSNTNQSM